MGKVSNRGFLDIFGEIKNFRIFRIVIFVEKYGHEDSEQDFLYKKLTFSKHFLATFWQCSQSGKLNAYTIRKSRGWFCVFGNFAEKSGQPAHISFLRFFKTRGTLLFPVPVTESQVPKVNRLRRKSNLPSKLQCKLHCKLHSFFSSRKSEDLRIPDSWGRPISHRSRSQIRFSVRALSASQVSVTWWAARQSLCVSSRWVGASSGSLSSRLRAMAMVVPAPSTFLVCGFSKRDVLCCFRCLLQKAKFQK